MTVASDGNATSFFGEELAGTIVQLTSVAVMLSVGGSFDIASVRSQAAPST